MSGRLLVSIPDNNVPERTYAVSVLLGHLLGLQCDVEPADVADWEIHLPGGRLVVRDAFFNLHPSDLSYLTADALPRVTRRPHPHAPEEDLVVLYGAAETGSEPGVLTCGADVFASAFFMLTRWEERVRAGRDQHGRLPSRDHCSVANGFERRPVVNEYAELLRRMLEALGQPAPRPPSSSTLIETHDVDRVYRGPFGKAARRCVRLRHPRRFLIDTYYRCAGVDVLGTFRRIMDSSEERGNVSRFYFIAGGATDKEGYYELADPMVATLIAEIRDRGHVIGLHPSYETYRDPDRWNSEKRALEAAIGKTIAEGRQHYLRFENPVTWRLWEQAGMETDSTMGFADRVGFRCGTASSFPVFDILDRRMLTLEERPLIVMDSALLRMESESARREAISVVAAACKRYGTPFTVLFHNHLLDRTIWNRMEGLYASVLDGAGEAA